MALQCKMWVGPMGVNWNLQVILLHSCFPLNIAYIWWDSLVESLNVHTLKSFKTINHRTFNMPGMFHFHGLLAFKDSSVCHLMDLSCIIEEALINAESLVFYWMIVLHSTLVFYLVNALNKRLVWNDHTLSQFLINIMD